MDHQPKIAEPRPSVERPGRGAEPEGVRAVLLGVWLLVGLAIFGKWLFAWARFAWTDDLASYVLLIPVISGFLIWQNRRAATQPARTSFIPGLAMLVGAIILGGLAWRSSVVPSANPLARYDHLAPAILGFLFFLLAGALLFLGAGKLRPQVFPLGFLIFAAPLPSWAVHGLETFFQYTSAEVAAAFINLAQIPNLRDGLVFKLPGITIQVAQECSGIRSSLVLFITSILAGHLFLKSAWKRTLLAVLVIPLGIVRNGFRILTIAALCTHVGPEMIDSPIHHRGGPIFFALSLVPLFGVLLWLRWLERSRTAPIPSRPLDPKR